MDCAGPLETAAMSDKIETSAEAMRHLEAKIGADKVLSNAFRLSKDAEALYHIGSFASCVALASLAFEEIGKHLLNLWHKDDPAFWYDHRRLHQAKQDATAAAIACDGMRRQYMADGINFQGLHDYQEMSRFAQSVQTGYRREEALVNHVAAKGMEFVKWSGLYYDADMAAKGIEPANIKAQDAESTMMLVSRAFLAISDDKAVAVGKTFFGITHRKLEKKTRID
jgi:AbiV family abortive infection protein